MAKKDAKIEVNGNSYDKLILLMSHYTSGREDMDARRLRKNGWNDCVKEYLGVLPDNWPYRAKVTDPRVRTSLVEKNGRMVNTKLQGRLVPREGGDIVKAKINNAILDYQWDQAQEGGSMLEKISLADLVTRIYGAAFIHVYWNNTKNCNDVKLIDPRDIFFDPSATHIKNASWIQMREYTTVQDLKDAGFDVSDLKGISSSAVRSNDYESIIKQSRGLQDKVGSDLENPTVEVITEWTDKEEVTFLPDYGKVLRTRENPYDHKQIPVVMLRYNPLGDDIYGQGDIEPVIRLSRGINAILCGYVEQQNLQIRPMFKGITGQYRPESIKFGPSAIFQVNRQDAIEPFQFGSDAITSFNNTYPALVNALNTAMGDQSLGVSNTVGKGFSAKTATEVRNLTQQQSVRDQKEQIYMGEMLKDLMMMWVSNNKQYLFDDPAMEYKIIHIVGKAMMEELQKVGLNDTEIPPEAMQMIGDTIETGDVSPEMLQQVTTDSSLPKYPVQTGVDTFAPKLDIENGQGRLYLEKGDLEGEYDYIPDVKSMSIGAGESLQNARQIAYEASVNPVVMQNLAAQGKRLKMDKILANVWEDAGMRDAESLIEDINSGMMQGNEQGAGNPAGANVGGVIQPTGIQGGTDPLLSLQGQGAIPEPGQIQEGGNFDASVFQGAGV